MFHSVVLRTSQIAGSAMMYSLNFSGFCGFENSGDVARTSALTNESLDLGTEESILGALLKAVDSAMTAQHPALPTKI